MFKPFFNINYKISRWIFIFLFIAFSLFSLLYNQYIADQLHKRELNGVTLWADAIEHVAKLQSLPELYFTLSEQINNDTLLPLEQKSQWIEIINKIDNQFNQEDFIYQKIILENPSLVPAIVINTANKNIVHYNNVNEKDLKNDLITEFTPLETTIILQDSIQSTTAEQRIYYGESNVLSQMRMFPYIQMGLLIFLIVAGGWSFRSMNKAEESRLWVAMAKETAHQFGTPLTSINGWITLLYDVKDPQKRIHYYNELELDLQRLYKVIERFDKIGSQPKLVSHDIYPLIMNIKEYFSSRIPQLDKKIHIQCSEIIHQNVMMIPILLQWSIENLVKNSIDSHAHYDSPTTPYIEIKTYCRNDKLYIDVIDNGPGIHGRLHQKIFTSGFTTKKTGRGLGLSLVKRIIEQYHHGKVWLVNSQKEKKTCFRIMLKRINFTVKSS